MDWKHSRYIISLLIFLTSYCSQAMAEYNILPPDFTSNLAIVVINTNGGATIPDEPKINARMGIISNGPGQTNSSNDDFNAYDGWIGIEIRGASSQGFPKKGYGFKTLNPDGTDNNVALLDMPEEHDWVFHGPYTDKSLLRNSLAYFLGRLTNDYAPNTRLCEVVINGDYRGVYLLTERIKRDDNRVDVAKVNPDDLSGEELTGGYLFQIDRDDQSTSLDGWYSNSNFNNFYSFRSPSYKKIHPIQAQYIENYMHAFETDMSSSSYLEKYKDYVDIDSWANYFLVNEIGKHIDAYRLSFFMYKKKSTNGGKLHFGPLWDFNLGFGNFDYACSPDPAGWSYLFGGTCNDLQPYWIPRMTNIPEVANYIHCRWDTLRSTILQTEGILDYIDSQVTEIGPAADRNFTRWPVIGTYVWPNDYVGSSYEDEINFLKEWVTDRMDWMDDNMIGVCSEPTSTKETKKIDKQFLVFPNPVDLKLFVERRNNTNQSAVVQIYNLTGQKLFERILEQHATVIATHELTNGCYVYRIVDNNQTISTDRFIVKH